MIKLTNQTPSQYWGAILATIASLVFWGRCDIPVCAAQQSQSSESQSSESQSSESQSSESQSSESQLKDADDAALEADDAEAIEAQLADAFAAAQEARTLEDYLAIDATCQKVLEAGVTGSQQANARRVAGWARYQAGRAYLDRYDQPTEEVAADPEQTTAWLAQAESCFRRAVEADSSLWQGLHQQGICCALDGRFAEAVALFDRALEQEQQHADVWFNRAESLAALKRWEDAIADYTACLDLSPQDPQAFTGRGHARFQLARYDEALSDYRRCVQLLPENGRAYLNRGDAFQALGQWEKAADDYRVARARQPEMSAAYMRSAWLMATCPDPRHRNEPVAYEMALTAIDLATTTTALHLDTLAASQAANGWFEDAEVTLQRARELDPNGFSEQVAQRERLYQAGRPFVQESGPRR